MRRFTIAKRIFIVILSVGIMIPAGAAFISAVETTASSDSSTNGIVVPQAVLDKIRENDPIHYEKRVNDYKTLLEQLDVHPKFQAEIERLAMENVPIQDVLIAYEFLYHNFGRIESVKSFIDQKQSGIAWEKIFLAYHDAQTEFIPRSFDSGYLENLMMQPDFSADDVMIADLVSFHSNRDAKEIIKEKMDSKQSWKEINSKLNILYSSAVLPRVQVTTEQLEKYVSATNLSEDRITEALVLAHKLGKDADSVVALVKSGLSEEAIMAQHYMELYQ